MYLPQWLQYKFKCVSMRAALAGSLALVGALRSSIPSSSSTSSDAPNVLMIAIDDLRPQFGRVFGNTEVKTPNIDAFFLDGGGSAMQQAYVQIAVCGPSRASILTGRRPDSTFVNNVKGANWCWCERGKCQANDTFMTLPTYMRQHGYITSGTGKIFHPDACVHYGLRHSQGDDPRAWSYYDYFVEANVTQEQWGSIPGPHDPVFNKTMGPSSIDTFCGALTY